jgi:regulator of cell morphogenesis and NO signaling
MVVEKGNSIGEVVAKNFQSARVFEEFGLDFCCGGKKSIDQACRDKGIDENQVLQKLSTLENENPTASYYADWDAGFLIDYIINNHHSYIRKAIPSIENHLHKVVAAHGERHPEVVEASNLFAVIRDDLLTHMVKEEKMLFPYIQKMNEAVKGSVGLPSAPFGNVSSPIKVMMDEHQQAGDEMAYINKLTNNYTPPANACGTFRVLYSELKDFEKDLHVHVHLENNILFPKAEELERNTRALKPTLCDL